MSLASVFDRLQPTDEETKVLYVSDLDGIRYTKHVNGDLMILLGDKFSHWKTDDDCLEFGPFNDEVRSVSLDELQLLLTTAVGLAHRYHLGQICWDGTMTMARHLARVTLESLDQNRRPWIYTLGFVPDPEGGFLLGILRSVRDLIMEPDSQELKTKLLVRLKESLGLEDLISSHRAFIWYSDEELDKKHQRDPCSLYAILSGRGQLFPSRRVRVSMTDLIPLDSTRAGPGDGEMSIPVSRFGGGMTRGQFFTDQPHKIKGTFFYEEPGSPVHLIVKHNRVIYGFNKAAVIGWLLTNKPESRSLIEPHLREEIWSSSDYTYGHLVKWSLNPWISRFNGFDHQYRKEDGSYDDSLWGKEDIFDEYLYYTRSCGVDAVILTHMCGSERQVSEVYDVRDREVSFASLYRPKS